MVANRWFLWVIGAPVVADFRRQMGGIRMVGLGCCDIDSTVIKVGYGGHNG